MDTDPQPPLPCPLINTALPQSNNPLFQLRVPLVELQKMVALGPISPLLSCPWGLLGLSCCSTPSCPCATTPRVEKSPGSCPRPRPVPLHQEPGSERSSSRTRGAHLASDGSSPQLPTGALVLLHAPLCSCPAMPPRAEKKSRELPQAASSAAAPRTGVREEQQPHQGGAPGLRRPQPSAAHGGSRAAPRPALLESSDATVRGKKFRDLP